MLYLFVFIFSYSIYRWKNWVIRGIFTWIMICGFCLIIYGGPLALMITVGFLRKKKLLDKIFYKLN